MEEILKEFVKPELLILIPVLYLIGAGLKNSIFKDNLIPIALGIFGIILSMIYVFATSEISGSKDVLMGIFISLTQGVLVAGCSVYFNQIYKQIKEDWGGFKMEIIELPDVISDTELVYEEVEEEVEWWRLKNLLLKLN